MFTLEAHYEVKMTMDAGAITDQQVDTAHQKTATNHSELPTNKKFQKCNGLAEALDELEEEILFRELETQRCLNYYTRQRRDKSWRQKLAAQQNLKKELLAKQTFKTEEKFKKELSAREEFFKQELSAQEERYKKELSANEEHVKEEVSALAGHFQKALSVQEERFRKELADQKSKCNGFLFTGFCLFAGLAAAYVCKK